VGRREHPAGWRRSLARGGDRPHDRRHRVPDPPRRAVAQPGGPGVLSAGRTCAVCR
jgi:hypothetical protein